MSHQKSSIAFSTRVDATITALISEMAGIPTTNKLDRYLGAPSIMERQIREVSSMSLISLIRDLQDEDLDS